LSPFLDNHGRQDLDVAARGFLLAATGAVQDLDEGLGRAVHDRHFRTVQLDHAVVDGQGGQGGHQVLDGRDAHVGGVVDDGAQLGLADGVRLDRHAVVAVMDVGAHEDDPGVDRGRTHGDAHVRAGVQAHPGEDDRSGDRMLKIGRSRHLKPLSYQRGGSPTAFSPHIPFRGNAASRQSKSCFRLLPS
jgi:hypothetical protein